MGKLKKTVVWVMAGALLGGLIYGVTWAGDAPVSAEISTEAKGRFVSLTDGNKQINMSYDGTEKIYPLTSDVWVYRNLQKAAITDLKPGDSLEIILNSKNQAAYIKAVAPEQAAAPQSPAPPTAEPNAAAAQGAGASPGPAAPAPSGSTAVVPPVGPAHTPAASTSTSVDRPAAAKPAKPAVNGGWPWERLSLELKSRELALKVKQEQTDKGDEADIYIQTKDRAVIHLNGAQAEQLLLLLMQGLPSEKDAWEKALKQHLAAQFKLKDDSPDWKIDVKWKDDAKVVRMPPVQAGKPEPAGHGADKEHGKGKNKGKDKDKVKEKEKAKNRDKYDDENDDVQGNDD
ncbi:hypothetical protein SAMN04487970_102128 [Paenibacillus tianmuensis]|uniref:DUF5666 domain-containing protein n=1 Tax=Paenibacillus tianmuensis TaxID=624147 RepID=A0A1G4RZE3_9BACL|nr:hypothetical protein [Paenibacillus tianmuensis]SCW62087.1 hypothetical protein SAMN04487970_102128 [Paenibacillus tianmuensis]